MLLDIILNEECSCCKESSGGIIMAEGKIFLKENRDRIEKNIGSR